MVIENEITLLTEDQVFGNKQLDILKKYGTACAISDFSILLGGYVTDKDRTDWWWTRTDDGDNDARVVAISGDRICFAVHDRRGGARPALPYSSISSIASNEVRGSFGIKEVEYGEYPQTIVDERFSRELEENYKRGSGIRKTGKTYTTDSVDYDDYDRSFELRKHEEFEYKGRRYIRIVGDHNGENYKLSDGRTIVSGEPYWVAVEPIKWLVDERANIALSKKIIFSGVQFKKTRDYKGDFNRTDIKQFIDKHFSKDIIPSVVHDMILQDKTQYEEGRNQDRISRNPYDLKFGQVSEEDIIRGAIESGIAVFLHGRSSEGKSARVKQIDPTCEIIYLRNATPESLNGKSVYKESTGEMIDIKPTWLKRLEEKCTNEPDRFHVVFFDELTNALPSIQGMAFNIVLDREVNGMWKLPENARIVAAGNDMDDSLAANQLAEPLFNRFAHVYIKTTRDNWLKWATNNNVHPSIIAYIAYKGEKALRTEYNGETPNADPRKWEMASKMLYATKRPEMLRSLVGEDITKEFIAFSKQVIITMDDVLNDNYDKEEIKKLNISQKYIIASYLSNTSEENIKKVRCFVALLGQEYVALFDNLWTQGDLKRLEILAELSLDNDIIDAQKNGDNDFELTLLSKEEIFSIGDGKMQLELFKDFLEPLAKITGFANLIGCNSNAANYGDYFTRSTPLLSSNAVFCVSTDGESISRGIYDRDICIRPIIKNFKLLPSLELETTEIPFVETVKFGEYPQKSVLWELATELEKKYKSKELVKTGKTYTLDSTYIESQRPFSALQFQEYEYNGRKFIRVDANFSPILSNIKNYDKIFMWVEVLPVEWYVDKDTNTLISRYCILSGINFNCKPNTDDFRDTEIYNYLNTYMKHDLFQGIDLEYLNDKPIVKILKK